MTLAVFLFAAGACVDVPDGVRAQFAGPGAAERTNFRPGRHGIAPPADDPPAAKTAETGVTGATIDAKPDGGGGGAASTSSSEPTAADGGAW